MAGLNGKTLAATYESLLKVSTTDNQNFDSTVRNIVDGLDTASCLSLTGDGAYESVCLIDGSDAAGTMLEIRNDHADADTVIHFKHSGDHDWVMGTDASDSSKFKISRGSDFGTAGGGAAVLTMDTNGYIAVGNSLPDDYCPTRQFEVHEAGGGDAVARVVSISDDSAVEIYAGGLDDDSILTFGCLDNVSAGKIVYDHDDTPASQVMTFKVGDIAGTTALQIWGYGAAEFKDDVRIPAAKYLWLDGDTKTTGIRQSTNDIMQFEVGGDIMLVLDEEADQTKNFSTSSVFYQTDGVGESFSIQVNSTDNLTKLAIGGSGYGDHVLKHGRYGTFNQFAGKIMGVQHYNTTAKTLASNTLTVDMSEGPYFAITGEGSADDYLDFINLTDTQEGITTPGGRGPSNGMTIWLRKVTTNIYLRSGSHTSVTASGLSLAMNAPSVEADDNSDGSYDNFIVLIANLGSVTNYTQVTYGNGRWIVVDPGGSCTDISDASMTPI